MNATSIDPVVQTVIVGASVHALGAVAALTLYSITRRDRYLLFWGLAGAALCLRWGIHYWGETDAHARFAEMIAASLGLSFILIGALDLLPNRKISLAHAGCVLAAVFSAAIVVSIWTDMPYTVFYTILPVLSMLAVWCLWKSYRHTRQLGLGVAALAYLGQTAFVVASQQLWGIEVRNMIAGPLFSLLVISSFIFVACQRNQRRQAAAEHTLRQIVDIAPIPLIICKAPSGEIRLFNRAAQELAGIPAEEMYGKTAVDIQMVSDPARRQAMYDKLRAGETVVRHEMEYSRHGKERALFAVNARTVRLDDGAHYVFVLYDITELRAAQNALENLNASLERQVAERTQDLDAFCFSISHDLRAPVRQIDSYAGLLEEELGSVTDSARRYMGRIRTACERMNHMVEGMLRLARQTRAEMHTSRIDLSALANELRAELIQSAPERQVDWRIQDGLRAEADPVAMRAVLDNLMRNAWKYTSRQADTRIEFGATERDGEQVFYLRDNGVGFDPRFAERLFQPFQRLHSASEFEGTGIGLATVWRLVQRHGGRIWAESAPGQGATFRFTLRANPQAPQSGERHARPLPLVALAA